MESTNKMELTDKVAVLSGASSGIGEAVARELSSAGMRVILTGLGDDKLQAVCAALGGPDRARSLGGDVADPKLPAALLQLALDSFGQADVLFNNAGVMVVGPVDAVDIEKLCQMVRIDVEAAFRMAYTFARHFKGQKSGFLINTSSIAGITNYPGMAGYCGAKHAIESLSDCLRAELAPSNVRVAVIEPGVVATSLYDTWTDAQKKMLTSQEPLRGEDIAQAVRFLLQQPERVAIGRLLITPADEGG